MKTDFFIDWDLFESNYRDILKIMKWSEKVKFTGKMIRGTKESFLGTYDTVKACTWTLADNAPTLEAGIVELSTEMELSTIPRISRIHMTDNGSTYV